MWTKQWAPVSHKRYVFHLKNFLHLFILVDVQRAGPGEGPIQGVGGGPRVLGGGGPTPGTEAGAVDLGQSEPGRTADTCSFVLFAVNGSTVA